MTNTNSYELPSSFKGLTEEISRRMTDRSRLEHTLSVAYECLSIAGYFDNIDTNELCTAALLHDIAKGLSTEEFEDLDRKYAIGFTAYDREAPAVMHAKAGSLIASREFSASANVSKAIAEHTTGASDMSLISKILFNADYV
jgi:predicted HD superfamily hydrolase involved in NAD metabolism